MTELLALTPAKDLEARRQIARERAEATKRFCAQPAKVSYHMCANLNRVPGAVTAQH